MHRLLLTAALCAAFGYAFAAGADDEQRSEDANDRRDAAADNAPRREGDAAGRGRREDAAGNRGERRAAQREAEADREGRGRGEPPAADDAGRRGRAFKAGELVNPRAMAEAERALRARGGMDGRGDVERLKQEDPEMFALLTADHDMENQTRQLVDQYRRAAGDTDREQIRGKLTAVVENHFAVRQQRRELEVKRLEAQLQRLRDSLKKRTDERQKLIDQHLSQLLGGDDAGF